MSNNPTNVKPAASTSADVTAESILDTAAKGGNLDDASFKSLLHLMMLKEKRLIQKEADLETLAAELDRKGRENCIEYTKSKITTQKRCKHMKGGNSRQRGQQRDPAVYMHTFTDGSTVIKCQLCAAKWMPKDTAEFLYRGNVRIENWTGIGWKEAVEMAGESSNKSSSSERFFKNDNDAPEAAPKNFDGSDVKNLQI